MTQLFDDQTHNQAKNTCLQKSSRFTHRKAYCHVAIQIVVWGIFYFTWKTFFPWRTFSDARHESISFFLIPLGIYLFYFISYKTFYHKGNTVAFLSSGILLCTLIAFAEYFYIIDTITSHIPTDLSPDSYQEAIIYTRHETLISIALRDFALFSIAGFGLVFKDALKFNKLLKEHINSLKENKLLEKDMQSYLSHDHFTKDILNLYMRQHPEIQKDLHECMGIYEYSYNHISCITYPLREEIGFARRLTAFYQRYNPGTPVSFSTIGDIPDAYILPLSTEPLITNMFKHGVTGPQGNMSIEFDFSVPNLIQMRFSNKIAITGKIVLDQANRQGLSLLKKRLYLVYQADASLQQTLQDDTCTFILTIRP